MPRATNEAAPAFLPLRPAAARLGVPIAWLRRQVEVGVVPHLRVGRRLLIHVRNAELALAERAQQESTASQMETPT